MIRFPSQFRALKGIHGYFYNIDDYFLYSIKPSGVLSKMKLYYPNRYNSIRECGFYLSIKNKRKFIGVSKLTNLILDDYMVPVV